MKVIPILLALVTIYLGVPAQAWDVSGLTLQGETAFQYDFLSTDGAPYPGSGGALNEQYRFNSAQLLIKKETDEISFLARLNYMPIEVTTPSGNTKNNFGTLDQLEVYYKINPTWSVGFGRLCSTLGLESAMRVENTLYGNSVAYLSIVPGYNEGTRLRYNPGEWIAVTLSSYNRSAYNQFGDDYTPTKTTELSVTGVAGRFLWFAGYYQGTDRNTVTPTLATDKATSNVWMTYKLSDDFSWSASFDSRWQKPQGGSRNYAQSISSIMAYTIGKNTLGLRYESILGAGVLDLLNGTTGNYYLEADKVNVWTFGDKYNLSENMKLYLEYRHDSADQGVRERHLITLGAVAHF